MKNSNLIDRQMFGNKSNFFFFKKSLTLSPQANKPSGHRCFPQTQISQV